MKIVHIIPTPCIFAGVIQRYAEELGHECLYYSIKPRFGMGLANLLSLYWKCRSRTDSLFVFHKVPHSIALALSLLAKNFRYALLYWGEDYYSTFINQADFEAHCIRKSPMLQGAHYDRLPPRFCATMRQNIRGLIGLYVLKRAAGIVSLCPKQFRILRAFYFRRFGDALRTPQLWIRGYSPDKEATAPLHKRHGNDECLTVLICHSATLACAHLQTLELLRAYKDRWNVKIHIYGFLSYSGGGEADRDQLEKKLSNHADFAESIIFERSFMSLEEVGHRLQGVDIAVFSCLRDEGVSLLTQFVKHGGVVSFNRFSMNYDFFKAFSPSKLMTHEQFLGRDVQQIRQMREQPPDPSPRMLSFEELDGLYLENGKLVFRS